MKQTIVINGVNLSRGSHVLLNVDDTYTEEEVKQLKDGLESNFPGVRFTLLCGVDLIGVYDAEPELLEIED